jgi:hypothetical protein
MDQATLEKCPTCRGKKHVQTEKGYAKCPECYIPTKVLWVLKKRGLEPSWVQFDYALLVKLLDDPKGPVRLGIDRYLNATRRAIHFHGSPSLSKQGMMAFMVNLTIAKFGDVCLYDTSELSRNYFNNEKRSEFKLTKTPVILTLGKEVETKLGSLFFREIVEHCSSRKLPIVLFTDGSPEAMSGRYPDFLDLYKMACFEPFEVPEIHNAL